MMFYNRGSVVFFMKEKERILLKLWMEDHCFMDFFYDFFVGLANFCSLFSYFTLFFTFLPYFYLYFIIFFVFLAAKAFIF